MKVPHNFIIARHFLFASSILCKDIVRQENSLECKDHGKKIISNDAYIFYPLMYSFYHGIELVLKGLMDLEQIRYKDGHKLSDYRSEVAINEKNKKILELIDCYIDIQSLQKKFLLIYTFLQDNNLNIDKFYLFLRYPNKKGYDFFEAGLIGQENESLQYYSTLNFDINLLLRETQQVLISYKNDYEK